MAIRMLLALLGVGPLAASAGGSEFLPRRGSPQEAAACVANDEPCADGADCCGVCAYIGASTWRCLACTPVGDECIPMGNRCCDGGNKQKDVPLDAPHHTCQATGEISKKYGITKYTCQSTGSPTAAAATGGRNGTSTAAVVQAAAAAKTAAAAAQAATAAKAGRDGASTAAASATAASTAKVLQIGDATADQLRAVLAAAPGCFDRHPVDTSNLGSLEGSLGAAVGCVQDEMEKSWGWRPRVDVQGSASCGQCEGYGLGATIIEVVESSGNWMFVMRLK